MVNKDEKTKAHCVFVCLIKKIKCTAKSKKGAILRFNQKSFEDEELPYIRIISRKWNGVFNYGKWSRCEN